MSSDNVKGQSILHAVALMPGDTLKSLEGIPENVKRDAESSKWGYRFSGYTPGPLAGLGIKGNGGYGDRTPECGYISLNGGPQYFCRLVDYRWMCMEFSTAYCFNNFDLCG